MKLTDLATQFGLTLQGDGDVDITGVAALEKAAPGDVSFLFNAKYQHCLRNTKASAVIVSSEYAGSCGTNVLVSANPYFSYAKIAALFHPVAIAQPGIHASAIVGERCQIADTVSLGPHVVIGNNVCLGEGVVIGAGCVIRDDVTIGAHTVVWPNVTICHEVVIGSHGEIASGVVIGSDGFGNAFHEGAWYKVPQMGTVLIADYVSIGANTTIDRGSADNTVIERGVKLDNQIQIAHNVHIGAHTAIAGCTGIAGSATIGSYCQIGGGVGIVGHISICDQVGIAGMSVITKSITEPGHYASRGLGLQTLSEWLKSVALLKKIGQYAKRIKRLEQLEQKEK
jgi:UDP-3-O-[3-hydroxymyristoyl] glucosamine N-acyltransferase